MSPASLSTIPIELVLQILSYLPGIDIENLARTYTKSLTTTCLPLIKHRADLRRNKKRMATLFPSHGPNCHVQDPRTLYERLRLEEDWGPFVQLPGDSREICLEYLDFDGTLDWLKLDPRQRADQFSEKTKDHSTTGVERVGRYDKVANLCGFKMNWHDYNPRRTLRGLGDMLHVPEGFRKLLRNRHMLKAIFGTAEKGGQDIDFPSANFNKVRWLKRSLWQSDDSTSQNRAPKNSRRRRALALQLEKDNRPEDFAEGFVVTFAGDQQGCWYYQLFVDCGDGTGESGSCVLGRADNTASYPPSDTDEDEDDVSDGEWDGPGDAESYACFAAGNWIRTSLTEAEEELSIWPADIGDSSAFRAHTYSFEEFLAVQWLTKMEWDLDEVNEDESGELDFSNIYVEPLRQHLIDIYSTKGRKNGWIQHWRPSNAPEETE